MTPKKEISVGRAYGFFDCNASKQEIETDLPTIREMLRTPSRLELSLIEGLGELKGYPMLMAAYEKAKSKIVFPSEMSIPDRFIKILEIGDAEPRYTIQVTYPNKTNERAAKELSRILNQAYQSPLYEANEPFRGAIVYEKKGKYISRD